MVDGTKGDGKTQGDCPDALKCQASGECTCTGIHLIHLHVYYYTPD